MRASKPFSLLRCKMEVSNPILGPHYISIYIHPNEERLFPQTWNGFSNFAVKSKTLDIEHVHYVRNESLWGVWMSSTWRGPHRAQGSMELVGPGQGCGVRWIWDPISLNTCFTNQPRHGTEKRQDTTGQHKWCVPFSNSLVLGSPRQFWMTGWGSHPIPLGPTQCHSMKIK